MAACKSPPALQFTVVGVMAEAATPPPINEPTTTLANTSEPASTARQTSARSNTHNPRPSPLGADLRLGCRSRTRLLSC